MFLVSEILIALVALLHLYFLVLEMFFWTKPLGLKIFRQSHETAVASAVLAANQGLYNGFLAAGLLWSLQGVRCRTWSMPVTRIAPLVCLTLRQALNFGRSPARPVSGIWV